MPNFRIYLKTSTDVVTTVVKSADPPVLLDVPVQGESNTISHPRMLKVGNAYFFQGDVVGWMPAEDHAAGK